MSSDGAIVLSSLLAFALIAVFVTWYLRQSDAHLERWAQENSYQILSKERRYMRRGPFF